MKLTIESTEQIIEMAGLPVRVWRGTTPTGDTVAVLVAAIAVPEGEGCEVFDRELLELFVATDIDPDNITDPRCGCLGSPGRDGDCPIHQDADST